MKNYILVSALALGILGTIVFVVIPGRDAKAKEVLTRKWYQEKKSKEFSELHTDLEVLDPDHDKSKKEKKATNSATSQARSSASKDENEGNLSINRDKEDEGSSVDGMDFEELSSLGTVQVGADSAVSARLDSNLQEFIEEMDFSPLIYSRSIQFRPEDLRLDTVVEKPEL